MNPSNCVQCGAITAKGGRLTPPEGGSGPEYQRREPWASAWPAQSTWIWMFPCVSKPPTEYWAVTNLNVSRPAPDSSRSSMSIT